MDVTRIRMSRIKAPREITGRRVTKSCAKENWQYVQIISKSRVMCSLGMSKILSTIQINRINKPHVCAYPTSQVISGFVFIEQSFESPDPVFHFFQRRRLKNIFRIFLGSNDQTVFSHYSLSSWKKINQNILLRTLGGKG